MELYNNEQEIRRWKVVITQFRPSEKYPYLMEWPINNLRFEFAESFKIFSRRNLFVFCQDFYILLYNIFLGVSKKVILKF